MASNEQVISTLNGLIQTCRDGQEGFQAAAEGVASAELRDLFLGYSRQRASFAGELQDEVRRLGGDPADSGSIAGTLHRGWLGLTAAVSGRDDDAVVNECERGEDSALANYRAALGVDLPSSVRVLVERQFAEVKEAHDYVRRLKRASEAGA